MSIFDNPLIKGMAVKALKSDLKEKQIAGYYLTIDEHGEVVLRPCRKDPETEIQELKKLILIGK